MKYKELFDKWGLTSLRVNLNFIEMEFDPAPADREAAWEMYVEMITRIVTQPLESEHGDEKAALSSIFSLFPSTREILRARGRKAQGFTKIAVVVLNQLVRPFTAKWHKLSLDGAFDDPAQCRAFRKELSELQEYLRRYAALLADLAEVEDITDLEKAS
ncbi:MAG: hypothetical protein IJT94_12955 [Oscillibacter sp.]|nr:hypothetical protein [Oscillibacter sp.]